MTMNDSDVSNMIADSNTPAPTQAEIAKTARCPKCGREVQSLRCGHCGSRLPEWQSALYGAAVRKLARTGGDRTDAGNKGGNGDGQPTDNGDASPPQWLFERCNQMAIEACGEPITLDVAAAEWNHKCERYFTLENDALTQDWDAKAAWCNPPYSVAIIELFVRKAMDAAQRGTTTFCLLPWWNYPYLDLCEQNGRMHRICGHVAFRREDGTTVTLNSQYGTSQLVVVVFGPTIQPGFGAPIRKDDTGAATSTTGNGGFEGKNDKTKATPTGLDDDLCDSDSEGTISAVRTVLDSGDEDLLQKVLCGEMSVAAAAKYVKSEARTPHPHQPPATNGKPSSSENPVFTVVDGDSSDLVANVARLYLNQGDVICDVTLARAVFWKKIDLSLYTFYGTDIAMTPSVDLRKLPYQDSFADHLVLDPPHIHDIGIPMYNSRRTIRQMSHADIITQLYGGGLKEASRVLKPGGLCWLKTCDEVIGGKQRWSHIEIYEIAKEVTPRSCVSLWHPL